MGAAGRRCRKGRRGGGWGGSLGSPRDSRGALQWGCCKETQGSPWPCPCPKDCPFVCSHVLREKTLKQGLFMKPGAGWERQLRGEYRPGTAGPEPQPQAGLGSRAGRESILCTAVCTAQHSGLCSDSQSSLWDLQKPESATGAALFPPCRPPATAQGKLMKVP